MELFWPASTRLPLLCHYFTRLLQGVNTWGPPFVAGTHSRFLSVVDSVKVGCQSLILGFLWWSLFCTPIACSVQVKLGVRLCWCCDSAVWIKLGVEYRVWFEVLGWAGESVVLVAVTSRQFWTGLAELSKRRAFGRPADRISETAVAFAMKTVLISPLEKFPWAVVIWRLFTCGGFC